MPSKAQATKLPTFGAFKKFETHMQNRLPSSTENSYREEERDSRVSLKANSIQIGIKFLIFQKIIFSNKFRSIKNRLEFSPLGNLLQLNTLWNFIMGSVFASIQTPSLVFTGTSNVPMMITRELPVWIGTICRHLELLMNPH